MPEALAMFRKKSEEVAALSGGAVLVDAACNLVEAILSGLHRHLPDVTATPEILGSGELDGAGVCALRVRFEPGPLVGEIATRTRIAVSVLLSREVCFLLQRPPNREEGPLTLCVSGLSLPRLPELVRLRELLTEALGSNPSAEECFAWWQKHKDREFPLKTSKFHRLVESMMGMRSVQMMPASVHRDMFWGYMNTSDLDVEAFEFHWSSGHGVTVTVRQRQLERPEDAEAQIQNALIARKMLVEKRNSGERLCLSAINVAAMIYGSDVGQPGAKLDAIVKLLSAAHWWGCGADGWHCWDETWLCTDKKDSFGRVVEKQGRIIWRVAGHKKAPVALAAASNKHHRSMLGISPVGFFAISLLLLMLLALRACFLVQRPGVSP